MLDKIVAEMPKAKVYIAHNITACQGGQVIGIFLSPDDAKACLAKFCGFQDGSCDWGHFIREYCIGEIIPCDILSLPRWEVYPAKAKTSLPTHTEITSWWNEALKDQDAKL